MATRKIQTSHFTFPVVSLLAYEQQKVNDLA
ncbi:MAG: hypothetical protein K0S53_2845 [Bacteroidetes bacterium]|jgi:hypothetical protein|nr:hypothetical protein [Bacteroidota bacterium]MDF2453507.1 hypothetical protein [Bacteroidota bacterium]